MSKNILLYFDFLQVAWLVIICIKTETKTHYGEERIITWTLTRWNLTGNSVWCL